MSCDARANVRDDGEMTSNATRRYSKFPWKAPRDRNAAHATYKNTRFPSRRLHGNIWLKGSAFFVFHDGKYHRRIRDTFLRQMGFSLPGVIKVKLFPLCYLHNNPRYRQTINFIRYIVSRFDPSPTDSL